MHEMTTTLPLAGTEFRARQLFEEHERNICVRTDKIFSYLMPLQWLACVIVALCVSPRTWSGPFNSIHPHVWAAVVLGGIITLWPVFCALRWPGRQITRQTIAIGQMLMSALLIHLSGGRIEAHFHIFGSLAFLAFYRDRRVLISASLVVALDHYLRGVYLPLSVFGTLTASPYRWLEHTGWVLFEDVFLMISISQSLKEMMGTAQRQATLEAVNASIGRKIADRTAELTHEVAERVHITEVLAQERRQFETTLNNIPLVVFEQYFDDRENGHFVSAHLEEMMGYTPQEWTADPNFWMTRIHPDDLHLAAAHTSRDLEGIAEAVTEWRWVARDGKIVWGDTHATALLAADGTVIGVRGITIDITERKKAEAEMHQMQKQLLEASRQAGMAEVATNVLDNIENVLNRVNNSHALIAEQVRKSDIGTVGQTAGLLERHANSLPEFLTTHPTGRKLPKFFSDLAKWLAEEQTAILAELNILGRHISHIKEVIAIQQGYARAGGVREALAIPGVVEHALEINSTALAAHQIEVVREFGETPVTCLEKHKVVQILVNLFSNARNSLAASERVGKRIIIRTACHEEMIRITVTDNGAGLDAEDLKQIFSCGFTNNAEGHCFSLHSSALAASEMGGALTVTSAGPGQGSTFSLQLPVAGD